MSEFQPIYPDTVNLDPNKRVHYSHGLVLGVDEFEQEQLYFRAKDQLHNRTLHGYGTVCGLNVQVRNEDGEGRWEVLVEPGLAVDRAGQPVRVPQSQCAELNPWLRSHSEAIAEFLGVASPPTPGPVPLTLSLVLCYDQCKTDHVPLPSGPCQSLDEASSPSRIADHFRLQLQFEAPQQAEQAAARRLVGLLGSIEVSDSPGGLSEADMEEIVRSQTVSSPPPHMHPGMVDTLVDTALRVWVTEVRPELLPGGRNCANGPPQEECILLAQLALTIEDTGSDTGFRLASGSEPEVVQGGRPILLHTRLLQECLWQRFAPSAEPTAADSGGASEDVVHLSGSETITGAKTFAAPLTLSGAGRVAITEQLPASVAHSNRGAPRGLFNGALPGLHFITNGDNAFSGEARFALPIPDDIDRSRPLEYRLIWGFQGDFDAEAFEFEWRAGIRFFRPGEEARPSETPVTVPVRSAGDARHRVLATEFFEGGATVESEHCYGVLSLSVADPGQPLPQLYLLQVEMRYTANRLGGKRR